MPNSHNYLGAYDNAITALVHAPLSLEYQHQAVLSLARAGALNFAWQEYKRYGLNNVNDLTDKKYLEDIMSLKGRLLKDMALRAKNGTCDGDCIAFARRSVRAYENAFAATGGYYSGINVATMSLLGGRSERTLKTKVKAVLNILPDNADHDGKPTNHTNREDTYYTEATRAEAYLLLGDKNQAGQSLQEAVLHDPLNFTAHATTLKQMRLILELRGESMDWLTPFTPPAAVQYAGHIFSTDNSALNHLNAQEQSDLRIEISDKIQRLDIGFGYGALAAGSDILIAETLLDEGAELHVILPVPVDQFIKSSITPFGKDWDERFDTCLMRASSVRICRSSGSYWPDKTSAIYASQNAMGRTVMRANSMQSRALQLLILDDTDATSVTGMDAQTWGKTDNPQVVIPYPKPREHPKPIPDSNAQDLFTVLFVRLEEQKAPLVQTVKNSAKASSQVFLKITETGIAIAYRDAGQAADCACKIGVDLSNAFPKTPFTIAGHYGPYATHPKYEQSGDCDILCTAENISKDIVPGNVFISESLAAILSAFHAKGLKLEFAGSRQVDPVTTQTRLFVLERTHSF